MPPRYKKLLLTLGLLLGLIVVFIILIYARRPPRTAYTAELFQGVLYERTVYTTPRPLMVHRIEIDLTTPGIGFLVTPGDERSGLEIPARTTSIFAEEFGTQIAINASFFEPFRPGNFYWDYYPHNGDPVNVIGLAISNGEQYSTGSEGRPVICISAGLAQIRQMACPTDTEQALGGNHILVKDGQVNVEPGGVLHPRTAVAVDESGQTVWLVVVDGRQPNYSEGVTLAELAQILTELGAEQALNLDGGGSSAMVMLNGKQSRALNAPIHKRVPMWQRPVANHLGVYAEPLLVTETE